MHKRFLILLLIVPLLLATTTSVELTTQVYARAYTVAQLPAHRAGAVAVITDAATSASCATGSGSLVIACYDNGATWTSLTPATLVTNGIHSGEIAVVTTSACTTGAHCTLGGTYHGDITYNEQGTAGTAVFYDLPSVANTVVGDAHCIYNDIVSGTGAADTGVITITPAATAYLVKEGTIGVQAHTMTSGGAAGDGVCLVARDTTHWDVKVYKGTWTLTP